MPDRPRENRTLLTESQAPDPTLDWTETVRRLTRVMVRALGADVGGAWLLGPARDRFLPLAGYHVPKELVEAFSGAPLFFGHPLIDEARRLEGPIYSDDSQADPRFDHPLLHLLPHKSVLALPMWLKGEVIGGFAIAWTREAHRFTPEELRLVEGVARQAAIAIENARLLEAEREARERLAISETRYRELFENVIDIVFIHDLEGKILAVNEAGARAGGYSREELLGMNIARLMAPEDLARQAALIGRMIQGERVSEFFTAEFVRKDGSRGFLECSGRLVVKDGVPIAVQGVARDVTLRRRLEERQAAMAKENARLLEEAERRRRVAESLAEMGRLISHSLDPEVVEQQVVDSVRKLLGTQVAALYEPEPGSGDLVVRTLSGDRGPALRLGEVLPRGTGVMGLAMRQGRPVVTPNVLTDPRITLPPDLRARIEQGPYRAVLAVPLLVKGRVVGALGIGDREGRVFDDEEIRLLQAFADHAAIALDNARLYREVSDHERILQALTDKLAKAQEEERKRVSREIHDELGQSLTAIKISLEMLHEDLGDRDEAARGRIAAAVAAIHDTLREMRRLSYDLRPFALDYLGLPAALRWHIDRFAKLTRIAVELSVEGQSRRLPPEIEIVLYRVTQEALRNLATHARASRAWCRLRYREFSAELAITDDGQGFSPQTVLESAWKEGRLGLIGIRERVRSLGGTFLVAADRGGGTRLTVEFQDARPGFPEMPHASGGGA